MQNRGRQADKSGNVGKGVTNIRTLRARGTAGVRLRSWPVRCNRQLTVQRTTYRSCCGDLLEPTRTPAAGGRYRGLGPACWRNLFHTSVTPPFAETCGCSADCGGNVYVALPCQKHVDKHRQPLTG